ncbi:MAG: VIT domain-containing protein [Verrucomicrobiota bacterium]
MKPTQILAVLLLCISSALAVPKTELPVAADKDQTLSPYFVVISEGDAEANGTETLPLKSTDVDVKISGVIADVEVRQLYHNTGETVLEAMYVFPGSTRAAVHGMTMRIGDRVVEAEVKEKREAKQIFEQAKAENKSASLLEQKRPNVFQMNVARILPGDAVEVTLKYTELLKPTEQVYEFVFPTVVGPRYSTTAANSPAASDEAWVANPFLEEGVDSPTTFDITVDVDAGMKLQSLACATHEVAIDYAGPTQALVKLDGGAGNGGNRDYILRYRLADDEVATGVLTHRDEKLGENFFLITVQPPQRVKPRHLPPREYIFVVDVSGSMKGFPMQTSKTLMRELIGGLEKRDRFNILLFAGGSKMLSPTSIEASTANVDRATHWLDMADAGGGTELLPALQKALSIPKTSENSRSIVVISDGYVNIEREAFELVRSNLGQANLFAFGIGSSVNRHLVEGLARAGRGEPFIVTSPGPAAAEAARLREYISAPAFTDIEIDFGDCEVYDVEPTTVPDVLADRPITIFGKFHGDPNGEVKISGLSGDERVSQTVSLNETNGENPALPFLWARDRIATLTDYTRLVRGGGADSELKQEIVNLGLTYNLLSEYTSFVAVDTVVRETPGLQAQKVKQPTPLPQNVTAHAVGGGTAPEPGFWLMLPIAALALLRQWHKVRGKHAN